MRIHVLSDLHLEMAPYVPPQGLQADVVVLAGDIHVGLKGLTWARAAFPERPVVYVAGNHEYYRGAIPHLTSKLQATARDLGIHFLEDEEVTIEGVRFLGSTLWTDFSLFGDDDVLQAMEIGRARMADYHLIRKSPQFGRLSPRDTRAFHRRSRSWIRDRLAESQGPTVVVTHHAPSLASIPDKYKTELLSSSYASDLDDMAAASGAALWVHGHTHHCVDYKLGPTRVVANQRGYPDEPVAAFDPHLVVEVARSAKLSTT